MLPTPPVRLAVLLVMAGAAAAAQNHAPAQFACASLRFDVATVELLGLEHTLALSSPTAPASGNGELAFSTEDDAPTHAAAFQYDGPDLPEPLGGELAVDVPFEEDTNGNGLPDFYEVDLAVPPTTLTGIFTSPVDDGIVTATWERAAGSTLGTCVLQLTGEIFGALPEFTHVFELFQYQGELHYTPATNGATGQFSFQRRGVPEETIAGPALFTPDLDTPLETQFLEAAGWTNTPAGPLALLGGVVDRDPVIPTNYFGVAFFMDGYLPTPVEDFDLWLLAIVDGNDSDGDGIPDLSDPPGTPPVPPPTLALAPSTGGATLTLSGDTGRTYDIEASPALVPATWAVLFSITLTNPVQSVEIAAPAEGNQFLRARLP